MYCRQCGKFVYEGGDLCTACRAAAKPKVVLKSKKGLDCAIVSVVLGLIACALVWVAYWLALQLQDVLLDISQNGQHEGNMGVSGVIFIFCVMLAVFTLFMGGSAAALGVVSIVCTACERKDLSGKRFAVSLITGAVGLAAAAVSLIFLSVTVSTLVHMFL